MSQMPGSNHALNYEDESVKKVAAAKRRSCNCDCWYLEIEIAQRRGRKVHIDPVLGPDPVGILCFGKTHFSAQFMKRDRSGQETDL